MWIKSGMILMNMWFMCAVWYGFWCDMTVLSCEDFSDVPKTCWPRSSGDLCDPLGTHNSIERKYPRGNARVRVVYEETLVGASHIQHEIIFLLLFHIHTISDSVYAKPRHRTTHKTSVHSYRAQKYHIR